MPPEQEAEELRQRRKMCSFYRTAPFVGSIWAMMRCCSYVSAVVTERKMVELCLDFKVFQSEEFGPYDLALCKEISFMDNALVFGNIEDDYWVLLCIWLFMELAIGCAGLLLMIAYCLQMRIFFIVLQLSLIGIGYIVMICDYAFFVSMSERYKDRPDFDTYILQFAGGVNNRTILAIRSQYPKYEITDLTDYKMKEIFSRLVSHLVTFGMMLWLQWGLTVRLYKRCMKK